MVVIVQPDVDSYVSKAIELQSKPVMLDQAKRFLEEKVLRSNLFQAHEKHNHFNKINYIEAKFK